MTLVVERHRTAMSRTMLSRPMALAYEDGILREDSSVLDYGCGRGGDVDRLARLGLSAVGWDPKHRPSEAVAPSDVVNLGYVINVIEDQLERRNALRRAWSFAKRALIVAARPAWEARDVRGRAHGDGILTAKRTFQKFYEQDELRSYVESTLGEKAIAAAPGIFYVFRDSSMAQDVLARRTRRNRAPVGRVVDLLYETHREALNRLEQYVDVQRRLPCVGDLSSEVERELVQELGSIRAAFSLIRRATGRERWRDVDTGRPSQSERRFEQYRGILEPLMAFVDERGRLPKREEIEMGQELERVFGSVRAGFSLVRRVTGPDRWSVAEDRARRNFLVYLALSAFGGRPRFSDLPEDLRLDVRELFGNYKTAVASADVLLFQAGDLAALDGSVQCATVGKLTREALYVHVSAMEELPPLLRIYEGCGQALAGRVEGATIVKLHREKPQVSYLAYPTFDRDPHPPLATVVVARLGSLKLTYRDFSTSENAPILHRKETFVGPSYPGRQKFVRLSEEEEAHGLLSSPGIGTQVGWNLALKGAGLQLRGHRVVRDEGPRLARADV